MAIDTVHDIQHAYRALVKATSFPGTIVSIGPIAERIELDTSLPKSLLLIAMTLLDAEVSFALFAPEADAESELLSRLTYSRSVAVDAAGYVLLAGPKMEGAGDCVARAPGGTLVEPHRGATIVVEVGSLGEADASAHTMTRVALAGPGIETSIQLTIGGDRNAIDHTLMARDEKNREYPMGVDLILYTADGSVACLPRTTRRVA